jgi:hypothetical protein
MNLFGATVLGQLLDGGRGETGGGDPPQPPAAFASSCMLSRMRSAMVSCSNWAKRGDEHHGPPRGTSVSNCSLMEIKAGIFL